MDTVAQMLNAIKNAVMARKPEVVLEYTKLNHEIAKILKKQQYITEVSVKKNKQTDRQQLILKPHYINNMPTLNNVRRISKSSRRLYSKAHELRNTRNGYGVLIVSTPQGVMTGAQAHEKNVGGEVLAEIW